jgi:hypothetical protein
VRVRALWGIILATTLGACGDCETTVLRRIPAPDGQREAIVFGRDCGATSGYSTQVMIGTPGQQIGVDDGNVLVVDDTTLTGLPAETTRGPLVGVQWQGNDVLELRYSWLVRVFIGSERVNGVRIVHIRTSS